MAETPIIGIPAGGDNPLDSIHGAYKASRLSGRYQIRLYCSPEQKREADITHQGETPDFSVLTIVHGPTDKNLAPGQDLRWACQDLAGGEISAIVTAANSEALTKETLRAKLWDRQVYRPCLVAPIPLNGGKHGYLADAGASNNVTDIKAYYGWAMMTCQFLKRHRDITLPRIGLANISAERASKELADVHKHMRALDLGEDGCYVGYAEPAAFCRGDIDILLCDGNTGNMFLKEFESVATVVAKEIIDAISNPEAKAEAAQAMRRFKYDDNNLLSPWLMTSGKRVLRLHGNTPAALIAKAPRVACDLFAVGEGSTW